MNLLMILLLLLPLISIIILHWYPEKYLNSHKWIPATGLILTNLIGIAMFVIIRLINTADYFQISTYQWFRLTGNSYNLSLCVDPVAGWILALWAAGSLLFMYLAATVYFNISTFRNSLLNLSLTSFAINGLVLANDLLTLIFFWVLLDLCAYRIIVRKGDDFYGYRSSHYQSITANLLLLLAALSLHKVSGTFQIDTILAQINSGEIVWNQIVFPGILIVLSGILSILQSWSSRITSPGCDKPESSGFVSVPPSDEFCIYYGLIPSGLFLIFKFFPLFPTACLNLLSAAGYMMAFVITVIILSQTDFRQLIRLNLLLHIALALIALGTEAVALGIFQFFGLFTTTLLLILFISDFQVESQDSAASGSAFIIPIRIVIILSLIGLPLAANFNIRLLLFNTAAAHTVSGSVPNFFLTGLTGLIFWMLTMTIFNLFLKTGALNPVRRRTPLLPPTLQWTAGGLALVSLYPIITSRVFDPLTTVLRNSVLFPLKPAVVWPGGDLTTTIVYVSILLAGLLAGFLAYKYLSVENISQRFAKFLSNAKSHARFIIDKYGTADTKRLVRFDTVIALEFGLKLKKYINHTTLIINQLNSRIADIFSRFEKMPAALSENIFRRIRQMQLNKLILIAFVIISTVIFICII